MFINPHDDKTMSYMKEASVRSELYILLAASDGSHMTEVMKSGKLFNIPAFVNDLQTLANQFPEVDFTKAKPAFDAQRQADDQ